jgi:hypothetical protein
VELPKTGTGKVQKQSDVKARKNGAQLSDGRKKSGDHQPEPVKERGAYTQITNKIEESVDNQSIPGMEKIQRQDKVKGGKSEARFANGLKDSVDHTSMPETGKIQKQEPAEKKAAQTRMPGRLNKQENHGMKEVKEEVEPVPAQEDQISSLSNRTAAMPIEKQEPAEKKAAPTRLPGRLNKQENHGMKEVKEEVEPVPVQEDQISGLSNRTAAMPIEKKTAPTRLPGRLNKQENHRMKAVKEEVEPVPVQEDQISSLSNRTAAMRIEQLRQEVHKLKAGDSSPSIDENREIKEEEQKQIPNPPLQPAVFSRQSTQQSQVPWAFWERSYLSRFHLKTLI